MTAPTPSPEEFSCSVWECMEAGNSNAAGDLVRSRDASLTAPLREEVEKLKKKLDEVNEELDGYIDDVRDNLPEYDCDDEGNEANERERIEFAGAEIEELKRARDRAEAEVARLKPLLRECLGDYGHPNFTDRSGMADRIRSALAPEGGK